MCNHPDSTSASSNVEQAQPVQEKPLPRSAVRVTPEREKKRSAAKRKSRKSSSSSNDSSEFEDAEWKDKLRRISRLGDILTEKRWPHFRDAKCVIATHKKFKKRLNESVKVKKQIHKNVTLEWHTKRNVLSKPQKILRQIFLAKAEHYMVYADGVKRVIAGRIKRSERSSTSEPDEMEKDEEFPQSVVEEATAILHKEYPKLVDAESIIYIHKKHKDRLKQAENRERDPFPATLPRSRLSEPQLMVRENILKGAEYYKWHSDMRMGAIKINVLNKSR